MFLESEVLSTSVCAEDLRGPGGFDCVRGGPGFSALAPLARARARSSAALVRDRGSQLQVQVGPSTRPMVMPAGARVLFDAT